jgi:hypothetical protein
MHRQVHSQALQYVAFGSWRDADDRQSLAAVQRRAPFRERTGAHLDLDGTARVKRLHNATAELAQIVVDDGDWYLTQDLVEIWLRVVDAVDQWRQHQKREGAADCEHAMPLGLESAHHTG